MVCPMHTVSKQSHLNMQYHTCLHYRTQQCFTILTYSGLVELEKLLGFYQVRENASMHRSVHQSSHRLRRHPIDSTIRKTNQMKEFDKCI